MLDAEKMGQLCSSKMAIKYTRMYVQTLHSQSRQIHVRQFPHDGEGTAGAWDSCRAITHIWRLIATALKMIATGKHCGGVTDGGFFRMAFLQKGVWMKYELGYAWRA